MKVSLFTITASIGLSLMMSFSYSATWPDSEFSELSYGLYWFGYGDSWEKAVPGESNPYYNKNKKTLIYIHGWQEDTVTEKSRQAFERSSVGGPNHDLAAAWLTAGYNVGILYWNQFADEGEVKDAEAKIWTIHGPQAMRWRKLDGSYEHYDTTDSVTRLLYKSLKNNMENFNGSELRIVGHSLGNQIALSVADLLRADIALDKISSNLLPDRIGLLDPFYSNGAKDYLNGDWAGERSRWAANRLINAGVAIEAYRSSAVTSSVFVGDANDSLMEKTAFTELRPWYFHSWEINEKHSAAGWHYLWSFEFSPPSITNSNDDGASAATSTSRIKELMNSENGLQQFLGVYTKSPSDDRFWYVSK